MGGVKARLGGPWGGLLRMLLLRAGRDQQSLIVLGRIVAEQKVDGPLMD